MHYYFLVSYSFIMTLTFKIVKMLNFQNKNYTLFECKTWNNLFIFSGTVKLTNNIAFTRNYI